MVNMRRVLLPAAIALLALVLPAGSQGLKFGIPVPVPNSFIANPQVTVAGKTVALGASTTVASTDLSDSASLARSSNNLSFFASTTSAQLAGVISDETGSGALVFGTAPTMSALTVTGSFTATGLVTNADLANSSFTLNGSSVSLGGTRTLSLASSDFANQGTATTVLHGNASGNPAWGAVVLTADVSGILPGANGGTGNGFTAFSGPTSSLKTFALPDASATILTTNALVTVPQGGTGASTITGLVLGNGASAMSAYAGSACTNQFVRSLSAAGAATCATVALATDVSGTLQAAQFPALTGDVTTSAGALATTLATVNSNVGSFGSSTAIPTFTVNGKGLITAASTAVVIAPAGTLTGTTLASNVVTASLTTINGSTVPTASDTFTLLAASQTLTNKSINASNNTITNLTTSMFAANVVDNDPALTAQSATRIPTQSAVYNFVTNALNGIQWKAAVVVRTTANITLSGEQTIDGVTTSASRVLVMAETDQTTNGCYVSASGAWARCSDNSTGVQILSSTFFIQRGTAWANSAWTNTNATAITVGVTNITFGQIAGVNEYSAGTGLQLSANQFSIDSTVTTLTGSQTLINKSISGASNTLSSIALSSLATQATNTVVGNATSGTASPTALAMTSCSTSGSAVTWTTNSGFGCNTAIAASTATTATNIAGGTAGAMPYQSGAGATALLAATTTAGQVLRSGNAAAPSWSTATYPATAGTAANVLRSDGTNFLSAALAAADLSNGVSGGGAVMLVSSPTTTGTLTAAAANFGGAVGVTYSGANGFTVASSTGGYGSFGVYSQNGYSTIGNTNNLPLLVLVNNAEVSRWTSSLFTVGTELDVTQSTAGDLLVKTTNTNAGVAAQGGFQAYNGTATANFDLLGHGYTTSGIVRQDGLYIANNGAGGLTLNTEVNQPVYVAVNSTQVAQFTSTGINSTAIGATTASTGAFTTLSATGTLTGAAANFSGAVGVNGGTTGTNQKLSVSGRSFFTGGTADPGGDPTNGLALGYDTGSDFGFLFSGRSGVAAKPLNIYASSTGVSIYAGGSLITTVNGSGLLVNTTTSGGWAGNANVAIVGASGGQGLSVQEGGTTGNAILVRVENTAQNLIAFNYAGSGIGSFTTDGTVLDITATTALTLTGIGADTATVDASLCRGTVSKRVLTGTGTLGICLGTSSRRFKNDIHDLSPGLKEIMLLHPRSFHMDKAHGDPSKTYYGFIAEEANNALPLLVGRDDKGVIATFDYLGVVPVLTKAVQQQQAEIIRQAKRIATLERQVKANVTLAAQVRDLAQTVAQLKAANDNRPRVIKTALKAS